jgi:hypothetical protein
LGSLSLRERAGVRGKRAFVSGWRCIKTEMRPGRMLRQ